MDSMCSRVDKQGYPPPLPVKQRRSAYSGGSSTGSSMDLEPEGGKCSPLGSLHETPSFSDVFSTPTDCHAPQCPIHHSAGFSYSHQERFFSETTPPPMPKKRLARAVSLPGGCLHPQCSLPSKHLSYDNPLYMLTSINDRHLERDHQKPAFEAPPPLQPLRLLTFDTPDLQLPCFFKNFQDQGQVSLDIQECHLLFLKRIAQQLETSVGGVESTNGIESFNPWEFRLCEGYQSKRIEDAVFYSVHCPKLPGRVFSAKVYRPNSASALLNPLPPHINIQQLFVHFPQCPKTERYASVENLQAGNSGTGPRQREQSSLQSPDGGSTEQSQYKGHTVASLLSEGYEVDIERELPRWTLEDFVRDGISLHRSQPQLYERQLSLLLLQVAQGLLHLHAHGAACAELQPCDVILAWSGAKGEGKAEGGMEGVGMSGRDATEREPAQRGATKGQAREQEEGESLSAPIHKLWKRWGPPRAVISTVQPLRQSDTDADSKEFRLGRLLLLCLHLPESPAPPDLRPSQKTHQGSQFPHGLLELAFRLLNSESGVRMAEAAGILQVLLWGPQAELFPQKQPGTWPILLGNWLAVKRSLLVQKLSELALSKNERPDHEDNLCLQYLSLADLDAVLKIAALLGLHHNAHTSTSVKTHKRL